MNAGFFILSYNCMKRIIYTTIIAVTIFYYPIYAEEGLDLEKIVVKQNKEASVWASPKKNSPTETFTGSEIKQKNLDTLTDLLNYSAGMDLRSRGPEGIQGDLSLRGSNFEQAAVAINGINVMDPQTGHHNLDIPLTVYDIDRVEVSKIGDSAYYGAGALAGSANFLIKKPTKNSFNLETLFGENALFRQASSYSFLKNDFSGRVSFEHNIAKAARPNTDFQDKTASIYLSKDFADTKLDYLFGYQKKDFGADSFYSNLFPEEEEHTETLFFDTGLNQKLAAGSLQENLYLRKHRDKFILTRNNPTSVNYHTTYVYGLNQQFGLPIRYGLLSFGLDTGIDEINSTNLGKRSRLHQAEYAGFTPELGDKLSAELKSRIDYYQHWGWQPSYNFGMGYKLIDDLLKVRGCLSRAFRIPSFTELFYSDPANKGNPDLKIETSDNFDLGVDSKTDRIELSLDGYLRQARNVIDWTRASESLPWEATNLGKVDFTGIEFRSKLKTRSNFNWFSLESLGFSYNYNHADKKTSGFFSKYALDILRDQYILDLYSVFFSLTINWQLSYNQRNFGETYFIGNLYIGKKFCGSNFVFEPFMKIDNFSNTKYSEISGVLEPGRWIKGGVKLEW